MALLCPIAVWTYRTAAKVVSRQSCAGVSFTVAKATRAKAVREYRRVAKALRAKAVREYRTVAKACAPKLRGRIGR